MSCTSPNGHFLWVPENKSGGGLYAWDVSGFRRIWSIREHPLLKSNPLTVFNYGTCLVLEEVSNVVICVKLLRNDLALKSSVQLPQNFIVYNAAVSCDDCYCFLTAVTDDDVESICTFFWDMASNKLHGPTVQDPALNLQNDLDVELFYHPSIPKVCVMRLYGPFAETLPEPLKVMYIDAPIPGLDPAGNCHTWASFESGLIATWNHTRVAIHRMTNRAFSGKLTELCLDPWLHPDESIISNCQFLTEETLAIVLERSSSKVWGAAVRRLMLWNFRTGFVALRDTIIPECIWMTELQSTQGENARLPVGIHPEFGTAFQHLRVQDIGNVALTCTTLARFLQNTLNYQKLACSKEHGWGPMMNLLKQPSTSWKEFYTKRYAILRNLPCLLLTKHFWPNSAYQSHTETWTPSIK